MCLRDRQPRTKVDKVYKATQHNENIQLTADATVTPFANMCQTQTSGWNALADRVTAGKLVAWHRNRNRFKYLRIYMSIFFPPYHS